MHDTKAALLRELEERRARSHEMIGVLDDDALHRQFDPIMSPLVWDVGHIGNFEEIWLLRRLGGHAPHDVRYDELYNPFDNPRWVRGDLPLLDRAAASAYAADVRAEALDLLSRLDLDPADPLLRDGYVIRMVAQHEAQHQETMLQALDLAPGIGAYALAARPLRPRARTVDDTERITIGGGPFALGTDDTAAAYDNERPRHRIELAGFRIDRFPVTNRRYGRFVAEGGYRRRELWSDDGWAWRQQVDHEAPQGWIPEADGSWSVRRFGWRRPLDPAEPVMHVSWFEAEAFARFEGGRLPTEAEWEKAATWGPDAKRPRRYPWGDAPPTPDRANLDQRGWGPAPVGSYPAGASAYGVEQLIGDVYEWTASRFLPYPGYRTFPYPEYSEVFFDDPEFRVLRGASWATSPSVARSTFRNWDYRKRRQIMSGIRLAWDLR